MRFTTSSWIIRATVDVTVGIFYFSEWSAFLYDLLFRTICLSICCTFRNERLYIHLTACFHSFWMLPGTFIYFRGKFLEMGSFFFKFVRFYTFRTTFLNQNIKKRLIWIMICKKYPKELQLCRIPLEFWKFSTLDVYFRQDVYSIP